MTNFRKKGPGHASFVESPKAGNFLKVKNKRTRLTQTASDSPIQTVYDVSDYMLSYYPLNQQEIENATPYNVDIYGGSVFSDIKPRLSMPEKANLDSKNEVAKTTEENTSEKNELQNTATYNNVKIAIMNNTTLTPEQKQSIIALLDRTPLLRDSILAGTIPLETVFPDPQVEAGDESFQVAAVNNEVNQFPTEAGIQTNNQNTLTAGALVPTIVNNQTFNQHLASMTFFNQEDLLFK